MSLTLQKYVEPFPHIIVHNMYSDEELRLIWQELDFLTHPHKLSEPAEYGAASNPDGTFLTTAKALILDFVYTDRKMSNILTVNRKLFNQGYLDIFSELDPTLKFMSLISQDMTKIRYYQNNERYEPHTDYTYPALALSYFHREPKLFSGGELIFPSHLHKFDCLHNSMILFPGYVEHQVSKITTNEKPYSGGSRYCMTQFLSFS